MSEPQEALNKNKRAQQKRDLVTRETVIRALMGQRDGRRYIWLELEEANVFSQTYVLNSFDATAFKEGQRSRGNKLLMDVIRWTPEDYITMTRENASVALPQPEELKDDLPSDAED